MLKKFFQIWGIPALRNKILFTLFLVLCFRILSQITVPGINTEVLNQIFLKQDRVLGAFAAFTGGSVKNFSIMLMGLSPYINASIIMQLMTVISPRVESWKHEGEEGRRRMNRWTRRITVPLAFLQSYGMILLMNSYDVNLIPNLYSPTTLIPMMTMVVTGTILAMWLGELITEKGIGNGISILIFTGIVSSIPQALTSNLIDQSRFGQFFVLLLITLALTIFVVLVTEALRHIPITNAGRSSGLGEQASIPIRVNQAGMIPIIFAMSMVTFPSILANFFSNSPGLNIFGLHIDIAGIANFVLENFAPQNAGWTYILILFSLTIFFTYFYVSITFQPDQIAENIQKRGSYIPGIRPGRQTAEFLSKVSLYLNLWGGLFIGFVAVLPMILNKTFAQLGLNSVQLLVSGAGIIIIVGVVLELGRQINSQLATHDYEKLY